MRSSSSSRRKSKPISFLGQLFAPSPKAEIDAGQFLSLADAGSVQQAAGMGLFMQVKVFPSMVFIADGFKIHLPQFFLIVNNLILALEAKM